MINNMGNIVIIILNRDISSVIENNNLWYETMK